MDHITISDPVAPQLHNLVEPTEVRDDSGKPLGVFVPLSFRRFPGEPEHTREELESALAEPGGKTLNEIWRELGVR